MKEGYKKLPLTIEIEVHKRIKAQASRAGIPLYQHINNIFTKWLEVTENEDCRGTTRGDVC